MDLLETHGANRLSRIISILAFSEREWRNGLAGNSRMPTCDAFSDSAVLSNDLGVAFRAIRECPADPRVAAKVLGLVNLPPDHPHQRIPPIDGRNDQLDSADPVIAAPRWASS